MQIINKQIKKLIPYQNNPRKNDKAVDAVAASIKQFGFKQPIVIDKGNVIVCGHTRYRAAQKLGIKEIPCIMADDLSDEQIRAFRLADNKTAELAEWDFSLLDIELADIDLDMSEFGFDFANVDDFGTEFELPDEEKSPICNMTFSLHERQKELIDYALTQVKDDITETFGNNNSNGNALYEVVRQWAELKTSL